MSALILSACAGASNPPGPDASDGALDAASDVPLDAAPDASAPAPDASDAAPDAASACPRGARPFTPPTGREPGSSDGAPGARRLLLATSRDGAVFTRSERLLTDRGSTPNALVDGAGALRVYYTGATVDGQAQSLAVAVSCDQGQHWSYYAVELTGLASGPSPGDPDVVLEPDGTYVLFFTRGLANGRIGIHRARSTDGFAFAFEGTAFEHTENVLDSLTAHIGATWHQYTLTGTTVAMSYATSADGARFAFQRSAEVPLGGAGPYVLANWFLEADGSRRIYAFSGPRGDIRSFVTTDGVTLTPDPAVHLTFTGTSPLESRFAIDPAVVRLADGSRLMVYSSMIP